MLGVGALIITGHSGVGKTTLGKRIAADLGWKFVDIDEYFLAHDDLPRIKLSDGAMVSNRDRLSSYDWVRFHNDIARHKSGLVICGVHLPSEHVPSGPILWIELTIMGGEVIDEEIIAARRAESKGYVGEKRIRDRLYIHEVLVPFWLEVRKTHAVNYFLPVYTGNSFETTRDLLRKLCALITARFSISSNVSDYKPYLTPKTNRTLGVSTLNRAYLPFGPRLKFSFRHKFSMGISGKGVFTEDMVEYYQPPHPGQTVRVSLRNVSSKLDRDRQRFF